jgi:hypothetical protein
VRRLLVRYFHVTDDVELKLILSTVMSSFSSSWHATNETTRIQRQWRNSLAFLKRLPPDPQAAEEERRREADAALLGVVEEQKARKELQEMLCVAVVAGQKN